MHFRSYEEWLKEKGLYRSERRGFKMMKGMKKIKEEESFSRIDSGRTKGHCLGIERRVKVVAKQGSSTWCS